jgi:hypothetical protein
VQAKVAQFQERAGAGRFEEIRREYNPTQTNFEKYMQPRLGLGRLQRTTEAMHNDVTGYWRLVVVYYNSEFERGRAMETFQFRMGDAGPVLIGYGFRIGERMQCPMVPIFRSQCEIVAAS